MKIKMLALSLLFATVCAQAAEEPKGFETPWCARIAAQHAYYAEKITVCSKKTFENIFQQNGFEKHILKSESFREMMSATAGAVVSREELRKRLKPLCELSARFKRGAFFEHTAWEEHMVKESVRRKTEELANLLEAKKDSSHVGASGLL